MHRYLRWGFVAAGLSVPLVVGGFFYKMRTAPLTPAQELALQRLTEPTPPVRGKDASDLAWLLERDVPVERRHEVASQVRAFAAQKGKRGAARRDPRLDWPRFPEAPKEGEGTCKGREPGCLAYVAENRAQVAATLAANPGALALQRQIADYDGYRRGFPPNIEFELPNFGAYRRLLTSSFALRFNTGGPLAAIEDTCHDLAGWRRVGGDNDDLVASMIGVAWVREDLMLLADMLAKTPRTAELPAQCTRALTPSEDYEYSLCPAFRSEFALQGNPREQLEALPPEQRPTIPLWTIDWRRYQARIAEDFGQFCDPAFVSRQRADAPAAALLKPVPACTKWERHADRLGCVLFDSRHSQWGKYLDRRTDQAQMLALMRTVVWLRAEVASKDDVKDALARIPAELGLRRTPGYDFEHDALSIALHDASRGGFTLNAGAEPLPTRTRQRRYCCRARTSRNLAFE
jgi:hypothetical protein